MRTEFSSVKSPMVPTVHANWRYLKCMMITEMYNSAMVWRRTRSDTILFEEDAKHFHQTCKITCDKHNLIFYQNIKNVTVIFGTHIANEARSRWIIFDYTKQTRKAILQDWFNFVSRVEIVSSSVCSIVRKRRIE
jgi:coproporphyrinogen III oxidase